jgi:hypothetical protein
VKAKSGLGEAASALLDEHSHWFEMLECTEMAKSYKMVVLLAMLRAEALPGKLPVEVLAVHVQRVAQALPFGREEFGPALSSGRRMVTLLRKNPIAAWTGGRGTFGRRYFTCQNGDFEATLAVAEAHLDPFREMTQEIVEWRLNEYARRPGIAVESSERFVCVVRRSGTRPMLFLPDRRRHPRLPFGPTRMVIDEGVFQGRFVKVALNVVTREGDEENQLPRILTGWFGDQAGAPGTRHHVTLERVGEDWSLSPRT